MFGLEVICYYRKGKQRKEDKGMKKFTKETLKQARKITEGEEYLFSFGEDSGLMEETWVNYNGKQYAKTESRFQDSETGKELDTYYNYNKNNDLEYLVRNLDGTLEF